MIYVISGLSGSGKSTIANKVSKILQIPLVVTCTTRPMRPNEKDGVDYHFLTNEEYDNRDMTAQEHFYVASGELWSYGIAKEHLKNDCIIVLSPSGVCKLKEKFEVVDIMIEVEENERMSRILSRSDNQTKEEIERRQREDKPIFDLYFPEFKITNDGNINDTVDAAIKIIKSKKV